MLCRGGLLEADDARDRLGWDKGGFSLDAAVRIAGRDRAGLERRLRYCARPAFALERLEPVNADQVVYHRPKPRRDGDGATQLSLAPLELIDRLAALFPPPRLHRHRYHGVLAPNSPLRAAATAYGRESDEAREPTPETASPPPPGEPAFRSPARYLWARLLARLAPAARLSALQRGQADCRLHHRVYPVARILNHIGEPTEPPRIAPARGPPGWDEGLADAVPDWDTLAQPEPEYVFDQRVPW